MIKLSELIKVPISVGDTVLGGKFKNKKIKVKSIGKNDKGDITINGKPMMKVRTIPKSDIDFPEGLEKDKMGEGLGPSDEKRIFLMLKIYGQSWGVNFGNILKGINRGKPGMIKKGLKEITILHNKIEKELQNLI